MEGLWCRKDVGHVVKTRERASQKQGAMSCVQEWHKDALLGCLPLSRTVFCSVQQLLMTPHLILVILVFGRVRDWVPWAPREG